MNQEKNRHYTMNDFLVETMKLKRQMEGNA